MKGFKLAWRQVRGAGLRSWLNVLVLAIAFIVIIWTQGLYLGMNRQAEQAMVRTLYGGGQFWHPDYDPYDPLSLESGYGPVPDSLSALIRQDRAVALLRVAGTAYPHGRLQPVELCGIDPDQSILALPTQALAVDSVSLPVVIGSRMAETLELGTGDRVTLRWRDDAGAFDARQVTIVKVFKTPVQAVDQAKIWLALDDLRSLMRIGENRATQVVLSPDITTPPPAGDWVFHTQDDLLSDIREMVRTKTVGASILYIILMLLASLAIFDTQVLAIFRRRREIGTLIALGLTRVQVIWLFTLEGMMHGILAAAVAAVVGAPLFYVSAHHGLLLPQATDQYGFSIGETLYPQYTVGLVVTTVVLVMLTVTVVSFLPTRRIARLNPTDALRGKSL